MYKFYEEKNQYATRFDEQKFIIQQDLHEQKSAYNKFHEQ